MKRPAAAPSSSVSLSSREKAEQRLAQLTSYLESSGGGEESDSDSCDQLLRARAACAKSEVKEEVEEEEVEDEGVREAEETEEAFEEEEGGEEETEEEEEEEDEDEGGEEESGSEDELVEGQAGVAEEEAAEGEEEEDEFDEDEEEEESEERSQDTVEHRAPPGPTPETHAIAPVTQATMATATTVKNSHLKLS